jgi:acyl-coenzyme A synthetase/AMP-(fatty) acid ligase
MSAYEQHYQKSILEKESFWKEQAQQLDWFTFPENILSQDENGFYRWFKGGKLNLSYLCIDRHIEAGYGEQTAIIYDSPVTNTKRHYTYHKVWEEVATLAGALQNLGVQKGDRVLVYMPMIPEAVFAMLACARLGAIHSVVFGGFAPHELAIRIDDAQPKVIISASCGIEFTNIIPYKPLLDKAIEEAEYKPEHCIIFQREQLQAELLPTRDHDYAQIIKDAPRASWVEMDATDPLYILYTSGTTGKPKGIVRDTGGYAVALKYSMKAVYNVEEGETYWAASDVGWVVGHSYIVYAPLLNRNTTIVFEGKPIRTPDAGTFWRVIEEHKVSAMFTAPTAIRAIKKEDPEGNLLKKYNLSHLKTLFLAGERCDPATLEWSQEMLNIPVIDHWWQTESGWAMVANMMGIEQFPVKSGSATKPVAGYEVQILGEDGHELIPNQEGFIAIKLPLPPGCLPTLWKDNERFISSYLSTFEGYYLTGDGGYKDEDSYVYIMGRIDDVINVAGHRLSTGEMEEIVASYPAVAECAVIGIADDLRGQRPIGLVILKDGYELGEDELEKALVALIREKIGAVAFFRNAVIVKRLPKTRSGKILRKTMRKIADGEHYSIPSTIDDPLILTEIHDKLKERGVGVAFV